MYYIIGTELISADIYESADSDSEAENKAGNIASVAKDYIMDGHASVTALAETTQTGTAEPEIRITDTYSYNAVTGLYYLRPDI